MTKSADITIPNYLWKTTQFLRYFIKNFLIKKKIMHDC